MQQIDRHALPATTLHFLGVHLRHATATASDALTSPTRLGPRDGAIGLEQKPKAADLSDPRTVCSETKSSRSIDKQSIPLQNLRCNGDPTTAQSASKDPNGQKRVCVCVPTSPDATNARHTSAKANHVPGIR